MSYNPNFFGISTTPASATLQTSETNNSGNTILKLTPVRIDSNGDMATIDVSVEVEAMAIAGLVDTDINDSSSGNIINSGRIKDITTSAALGDVMFVSSTGGVTNIKPSIGVDGFEENDFVIRLGIVAKNQENPLNKDLLVNISIIGQI